MTEILQVRQLCKYYPGFQLQDISFSLKPGRIMGLIGKNGAGKSTTLKAMLNLIQPDGGQVSMLGRDFYQNEALCKEELGVVFGGIDFYPLKRLSTIAKVTRRFYPQWDQRIYEGYLRQFGIQEHKRFKELSNGMKVKFLLTLALSHHAKLFLLDEPTSGLDPISREELLEIFQSIVAGGTSSILFSTHITSDLEKCADDITYIHQGRVLQSGDRASFLRAFDHLRTPQDTVPLTLEEIMLRTERGARHEAAL